MSNNKRPYGTTQRDPLSLTPLPISQDANANRGAQLLGSDGQIYHSARPTPAEPFAWINTGRSTPSGQGTSDGNVLINGSMAVWQRGTTFTVTDPVSGPAAYVYTADRWSWLRDTRGSSVTISQQDFAVNQTDVPGNPRHFMRVQRTVAASSGTQAILQIDTDGADIVAGQPATISFWAKTTTSCTISRRGLRQYAFNTSTLRWETVGGVDDYTSIPLTSTWQFFTATILVPNPGAGLLQPQDGVLTLEIYLPALSTFSADIARVQVERGVSYNGFTSRSFFEELTLCRQYFETSYPYETTPGTATYNGSQVFTFPPISNGPGYATIRMTPKRYVPAITIYSPETGDAGLIDRFSVLTFQLNRVAEVFSLSIDAFTAGGVGVSGSPFSTNGYFHWVASCEF